MKKENGRHYYAGYNPYGTNVAYCSIGWEAMVFADKASRDAWVDEHTYARSGNIVAECITREQALKISGGKVGILRDGATKADGYMGYLGDKHDALCVGTI